MKHCCIFIILFALLPLGILHSEVIIKNKYQTSDTVNMGMCLVSDYLETVFIVENNSNQDLEISNVNPSFYIGTPYNVSNNEYQEFDEISPAFNISVPKFSKQEILIRYNAKPELLQYPLGYKTAMLKIGLFDAALSHTPSQEELVAYKEFILIAKKSDLFVDFISNEIQLDTVCINPDRPIVLNFALQNNSKNSPKIENEMFSYLNLNVIDFELSRTDSDKNPIFTSYREIKKRIFDYTPVNREWDTAIYTIKYFPDTNSSNIEQTSVKLIAFGAEQSIKLENAINGFVNKDTIDFGDVRIGNEKSVKIVVWNIGNLPFGALSQTILKEQLDDNEPSYVFDKFLLSNGKHLQTMQYDTFEIRFIPTKRNTVVGRYVVKSDIISRNVLNVNNYSKEIVFYLKGRGISPDISLNTPVLDFGNIIISENCPIINDTVINIYNPGNQLLRINNIEIVPSTGIPFKFSNDEITILPNGSKAFHIQFHSDGVLPGQTFRYSLRFSNNSLSPKDVITLELRATTEPLKPCDISFPKFIKAKSGREISIPILIDKSKISKASSFRATLSYDKSILEYKNYNKINTASESAWDILMTDNSDNTLSINIQSFPNSFVANDTLIHLIFNTFLSENISTPIIYDTVQIGNQNCDQIYRYDLSNSKAIFSIDSICGINFKTLNPNKGAFAINDPYPNPSSTFTSINYSIAFSTNVRIELLNSLGELEDLLVDKFLDKGQFQINLNTLNLQVGSYYCRITAANYSEMIKIKVVR